MKKRLASIVIALVIAMIPVASFAETAEISYGDASITMEIPGGDIHKELKETGGWKL